MKRILFVLFTLVCQFSFAQVVPQKVKVINLPLVPLQFNPIPGTGITISGTYPNITFNAPPYGWLITGNSGNNGLNFLGNTDAQSLQLKTNNITAIKIDSLTQNVGFGSGFNAGTRPAYTVDINGSVNVSNGNGYYLQNSTNGAVKIVQTGVAANFPFVTIQAASGTNTSTGLALLAQGTGFSSTIKSEILVSNNTGFADAMAVRAGGSTDGFSLSALTPRPIWIDASGNQSQVTSNIFNATGGFLGSGIGLVGIGMNAPTASLQLRPGFADPGRAPLAFSAPVSIATTAASGNGTNATITFAAQNFQIPAGSLVTISGMTPSGYNGTYTTSGSNPTSITITCTATGAQTVAGKITINSLLATPSPYKVENDSNHLYYTNSAGTRLQLDNNVAQTTLVAGTKAITISGLTTSSKALVTLVSIGGTVTTTWQYAAVCTANTLTITALTNAGVTDTSDTSVLNYSVTYQ